MTFTFYSTDRQAEDNMRQKDFYAISVDKDGTLNCYGGGGCARCQFSNDMCSTILLPLYKHNTTIEITAETHPEHFI